MCSSPRELPFQLPLQFTFKGFKVPEFADWTNIYQWLETKASLAKDGSFSNFWLLIFYQLPWTFILDCNSPNFSREYFQWFLAVLKPDTSMAWRYGRFMAKFNGSYTQWCCRLHAQALTLAALAGAAVVEYYDHRTGKKAERYAKSLDLNENQHHKDWTETEMVQGFFFNGSMIPMLHNSAIWGCLSWQSIVFIQPIRLHYDLEPKIS